MIRAEISKIKGWLRDRKMSRRHIAMLNRAIFPRYESFSTGTGLEIDRLGIPPVTVWYSRQSIVSTCDFLPDGVSLSGMPFVDSPHVEFARSYYGGNSFDHRSTRYFRLAVKGHLAIPAYGPEGARRRCQQFMQLCDEIKNNGYARNLYEPMSFVECRDGSNMVLNGKHRLACLFALGEERFDAVVCYPNEVRAMFRDRAMSCWPRRLHNRCLSTLASVGAQAPSEAKAIADRIKNLELETWADVYHPIPFEGFEHLSTQVTWDTPFKRLAMILKGYQSFSGAKILDLGANIGFYSLSLARRGADVTAVDRRPEYVQIARQVSELYQVPVEFKCSSINLDLLDSLDERYDIVLFFSVFQWIVDSEGWTKALAILRHIARKSEAMFFDVSVNAGKACLHSYPGGEKGYVENLLRSKSGFRCVAHIGDVHPYGTDTRHVFFCTNSQI